MNWHLPVTKNRSCTSSCSGISSSSSNSNYDNDNIKNSYKKHAYYNYTQAYY
jgi:hypothetical protein